MRPLEDRVLIEPVEAKTVSAGGIHLPDTAKEKQHKGTVIATGPGKLLQSGEYKPVDVNLGDVVIYARFAGSEIEVNGKTLQIVKESDILAVEKLAMKGKQ